MEKTIKNDLQRNVMKSELINDNTLLEFVSNKEEITISVRFIANPIRGIQEHVLMKLGVEDFKDHIEELLQISDSHDAIAIFQPTSEGYQLEQVYDTEQHEFAISDFVDLVYQKKFPHHPLKNAFIKEKK